MTLRTTLWTLAALVVTTTAVFLLFQRQLAGSWLAFGVHPDVLEELDRALDDQKRLAELDPGHRADYRRRFEALETLRNRLRILDHSRERLTSRYGLVVLALFGAVLVVAGAVTVTRQRREEARLERLRSALAALSAGRTDLDLGEHRGDVIGRVAAMVEETSRAMARDRRRLEQLKNLSAWQEAARRHAHEMRTPLTAARLELDRVKDLAERRPVTAGPSEPGGWKDEPPDNPLEQAAENVARELDRLAEFTRGFADFARLPRPRPERWDLRDLARSFTETFADAWPGAELCLGGGIRERLPVAADRDLVVQVLVNLTDNAVQAGASAVTLTPCGPGRDGGAVLEVCDDGPGVPAELRERLFEPYVTSRRTGEGMGLGLAISKKVLLDHGGDLELVSGGGADTTGPGTAGATFRLTFPPPGRSPDELTEEPVEGPIP